MKVLLLLLATKDPKVYSKYDEKADIVNPKSAQYMGNSHDFVGNVSDILQNKFTGMV